MTTKPLAKFDWLVVEDQSKAVVIRLAGGDTVRLSPEDAASLEAGLAKIREGSTVYLNRRGSATCL